MKKIELLKAQFIFSLSVSYLIKKIFDMGYTCSLGEAYRPQVTQEYYFKKGLSKTLNSKHLLRCAIDLNLFKDGNLVNDRIVWVELYNYWISLSRYNSPMFKNFFDLGHFQTLQVIANTDKTKPII
jgi:hypothetical protein